MLAPASPPPYEGVAPQQAREPAPQVQRPTASIEVSSPDYPAIHTVDLGKRYGNNVALASLSMTVPKGEVFGFLGPNGAGKTTAVKLFVGLTCPTSGEGWLLGQPIGDRATRRRIGYLPELFRYQAWLSAREVLLLHCELARLPRREWKEEIVHALDTVGLRDRANDRVGTFSKGMQQRLGLGVALLGRPELVFLDEPTSALDPVGRHDVREIIRDLKTRGTAVFLNSHLLGEVEQICDRVAVIDKGRVIAIGSMDELRGVENVVRLKIGGVDGESRNIMAHFGEVEAEGDWYVIHGMESQRVPDLLTELVRLGTRVYAVEPTRHTLEERFLELLGGSPDGHPDHRPSNSP